MPLKTAHLYVTAPRGQIHLAEHEESLKTLCGGKITARWEIGDDTFAGSLATCMPCKIRILRLLYG